MTEPLILIIGAGLAGLTAAEHLSAADYPVVVFDKGRGPGGRLSTRRAGGFEFDHGGQYFSVREAPFRIAVEGWRRAGLVAPWEGRFVTLSGGATTPIDPRPEWLVFTPAMNGYLKHVSERLDVRYGIEVVDIVGEEAGWVAVDKAGERHGPFALVLSAAPAPQAAKLLGFYPALGEPIGGATMAPCQTAMVGFEAPLGLGFDAARVADSPLAWIARNGSKPGRPAGEAWVLHAGAAWSAAHLELEKEEAARLLLDAFYEATGVPRVPPVYLAGHRWRYALADTALGAACLFDVEAGLGACGDWCIEGRIEAAWTSGAALADAVIEAFQPPEEMGDEED